MIKHIIAATALLVLITTVSAAETTAAPTTTSKPNILVIVSDDQGFADAGFQGSKEILTPNLDRLAASGLRCTNGYVTHPYCSPSRGLLTGRYQARFGHERNPRYLPESHEEGLPLTETLFPALLANSGYTTGWIGKWHLGAAPEFHPEKRGFTETFGFIGGGHHYQNWETKPGVEYNVPILRNGKPVAVKEHLTAAFGHEAAAFVTCHTDQPWFLYLAFNAPHTPYEPTAERLAKFAGIKDAKRRAYAAQISLLDDAIGEALAAIHATGQDQRTLIFFFSDNGGPPGGVTNNAPLRGFKGEVYEGGMHVPFLVSWPGRIPAGKDYAPVVSSLDVAATALALAGVPAPTDKPLDGVNLIPFLTGENSASPHNKLFWRDSHSPSAALRAGHTKFVRHGEKPAEVYDLKNDLGEKSDLATADPKKVAALQADVDAWMKPLAKHLAFLGLGGSADKPWPGDAGKEP